MPKARAQPDVLILGQHPCAYLAAEMLHTGRPRVEVALSTIPPPGAAASPHASDRLVIVNPALFSLHKPLEKLRKSVHFRGIGGVAFLGREPSLAGQWRGKSTVACVGGFDEIRSAMAASARAAGVKLFSPNELKIIGGDETGIDVYLDEVKLHPKAILLADAISREQARPLALPEAFNSEVMRRYSFMRLDGRASAEEAQRPLLQMSLDLDGRLNWSWMLPGEKDLQLAVEEHLDAGAPSDPSGLLRRWIEVLHAHGVLKNPAPGAAAWAKELAGPIDAIDIPAAGALTREIVANRTLLFGPAGGFYSACLEDIYPNCWSAVFAVKAIREALGQPHLQDALQPYRQSWGTTLGEYLRGPQQNLRFLLPLVYRNPVMTQRMAESILLGKSVVR